MVSTIGSIKNTGKTSSSYNLPRIKKTPEEEELEQKQQEQAKAQELLTGTHVRVNPDNTYDVTIGGKTFKQTEEQFAASRQEFQTGKDIRPEDINRPELLKVQEESKALQTTRAKMLKSEEEEKRKEATINQIYPELSQIGQLPEEQFQGKPTGEQVFEKGTALAAGLGAAAIGAKGGAAIGTMILPGIGTTIGAIGGGVLAGATTFFGKLTFDARQDVKVAKANFDNSKVSLNNLITLAAQRPDLRVDIIRQWNDDLIIIRASERVLREQNKSLIGKKLASNLDELADIEQFYRDYRLLYEAQFMQNLMAIPRTR